MHKLLLFYADRPAAAIAARKKIIASRLGDLCLTGAMIFRYKTFGSSPTTQIQSDASYRAVAIGLKCVQNAA